MPATQLLAQVIDQGALTFYNQGSLTDSRKAWATDVFKGKLVRVLGGTNAEAVSVIQSNNGNTLVLEAALPNIPEGTIETRYEILNASADHSASAVTAGEQRIIDSISLLQLQVDQLSKYLAKLADMEQA
jgi:hypothetical protein